MSDSVQYEEKADANARIYEIGYLLVPTLTEEDVPVAYGNLKEMIGSSGGEAISDEMPKMMVLAYTMSKVIGNVRNKFNNAYFGWVKFAMDSDKITDVKKKLDLDPNFIRFLIIKTVRENTVAAKRFIRPELRKRRPLKSEGESATPINKEEIDKEIEALVAN